MISQLGLKYKIKILSKKRKALKQNKKDIEISLKTIRENKGYYQGKKETMEKVLNRKHKNSDGSFGFKILFKQFNIDRNKINDKSFEFRLDDNSLIKHKANIITYQNEIRPYLEKATKWAKNFEELEILFNEELDSINKTFTDLTEELKQAEIEILEFEYPTKTKDGKIILRKPKYGELKKLCEIIAIEIKMKKFVSAKPDEPKNVLDRLTERYHIKTNLKTVKGTLRKLDYVKSHY